MWGKVFVSVTERGLTSIPPYGGFFTESFNHLYESLMNSYFVEGIINTSQNELSFLKKFRERKKQNLDKKMEFDFIRYNLGI